MISSLKKISIPPIIMQHQSTQCENSVTDTSTQTNLKLISQEYDLIMTQKELQEFLQQLQLKQQLVNDQSQKKNSLHNMVNAIPAGKIDLKRKVSKKEIFEHFTKNLNIIQEIVDNEEDNQLQDTNSSKESIDTQNVNPLPPPKKRSSIMQRAHSQRQLNLSFKKPADNSPNNSEEDVKTPGKTPVQQQQRRVSKFGSAQLELVSQSSQVKQQVNGLVILHALQIQKNKNLTGSVSSLTEQLQKSQSFCRELMIHLIKAKRDKDQDLIERIQREFQEICDDLPEELDIKLKEEEIDSEKEEEAKKQRDEQERQASKIKKAKKITQALEFNFNNRNIRGSTFFDKLMHPGFILAIKIRDQYQTLKKVVNFLPLKSVLRMITSCYEEKIKQSKDNKQIHDLEMQVFVFNIFLNKYGFKQVAEKKYMQFLLSTVHFNQIFRINMFTRMLSLMKELNLNFTSDQCAFYIEGIDYIQNECTMGTNIVNNESDQKHIVSYLRVLDYMKVHLEGKFNEDELRQLKNDVDKFKANDQKNKTIVVDVDIVMKSVLDLYRQVTNRTKEYVKHAFEAADLDGNGKINQNELITLWRHIESQKFEINKVLEIFDNSADIIEDEEKNLSFDKFTTLCVIQQLFTDQQQKKFLEVNDDNDLLNRFNNLKQDWQKYKEEINKLLIELDPYVNEQMKNDWIQILETLESRIKQEDSQQHHKPILIAHKILKQELIRLIQIGEEDEDT